MYGEKGSWKLKTIMKYLSKQKIFSIRLNIFCKDIIKKLLLLKQTKKLNETEDPETQLSVSETFMIDIENQNSGKN